jgi:Beta-lactamase superfamily domain
VARYRCPGPTLTFRSIIPNGCVAALQPWRLTRRRPGARASSPGVVYHPMTRFTLLGVGAMNSPRYSPAGLLISRGQVRVAIDGGPGAEPAGPLSAWLVTDERAELIRDLRQLAAAHGLSPAVRAYHASGLAITPQPVVHTSHPTYGYLFEADGVRVAWTPEFLEFPPWAAGTDLMFAEAAGWARPIRFAKGAGGHAPTLDVAEQAARHGVRRLVFAHIGRPTITALDAGQVPPFGEVGTEGATYMVDGGK